jgi:hypothetical protein
MSETPNKRREQLAYLFRKQNGKCHICGQDAVLDGNGGKVIGDSAVRFRLGSSFGAKGRRRPRVMVHRKCAQTRSDEIQASQPIEDLWVRSGHPEGPTYFYSRRAESSE